MRQIIALLSIVFSLDCFAGDIKYHINDVLSISVSDQMEMRKEDDAYTKWMENVLEITSGEKIVFQQKGLSDFDKTATAHYTRILIKTIEDEECGFPAYNDFSFSEEDIKELEDACAGELAPGQSFLTEPEGKVEKTGKGVRIKIGYRRTGEKGAVCVQVLYYFNYRYAAKVVASYRESEAGIWQTLIEQAINSIEWDEPFMLESADDDVLQNDSEFETEVKSTDDIGFVLGLLLGAILMACLVFVYRYFKTKQAEQLESKRQKAIENAIANAERLVANDDLDKAEQSLETAKKHCRERDAEQKKQVEALEKQVEQKVEKLAKETRRIVGKYKDSVQEGDASKVEAAKKELDEALKTKLPVRVASQVRSELKIIDDDYKHGFIPEQELFRTQYPVPDLKQKEGYYCYSLFPETGTTVFPFRRKRVEMRGFSETGFENKLRTGLADLGNYQVLGDVSVLPVDGVHPYEPDIAIIERENHLGIRIDIEIDEPYSGYDKKPIHYIGCGDEYRDANLCNLGWIVIRFSEKQVFTEAAQCIGYVRFVLSLLDSKSLSRVEFISPSADKRWTSTEAVIMAAKGYRESYLHHQFNKPEESEEVKLTKSDVKQTELEREASKHVQTVALPQNNILNIDDSDSEFHLDRRLAFEPKEHIYILDGVLRLKAVSDVVAHFFHPFDILEQSERYAYKNGMEQMEVIEMWDAKGAESREVGTFLHEQIEHHLKGESVSFDYPFEYDGEFVNYKKKVSIKSEFDYFLDFMRDSGIKPFRSEWRIFDENKKVAGTIDLICRNGSQFDIYDWKRSLKASPNATVWGHGTNGLEHIPDIAFYKYALQQNLYRFILERNYGVSINKMYLVVLHAEYGRYIKHEVPRMDKEIDIILKSL